jgi:hypothetical protein
VCEKQVQVERAEALWALHLRVGALAEEPKQALGEMIRLEQELWRLATYARENSCFGEIRELLNYTAQQFGVEDVRAHIREGLRLRAARLEERRADRQKAFGWILSLLLGFGASAAFADRFLNPLLQWAGIPLPALGINFVSALSMFVLGGLAWRVTAGRKVQV